MVQNLHCRKCLGRCPRESDVVSDTRTTSENHNTALTHSAPCAVLEHRTGALRNMQGSFSAEDHSHKVFVAGVLPCLASHSLPGIPPTLLPLVVIDVGMLFLLQHLQCLVVVVIGDLEGPLEVIYLRIQAGSMPETCDNAMHTTNPRHA